MQWLSDNGSIFAAHRTIEIALALNLVPCFTPVESPESNGMAEAFVKTFKRDYVRVSPIPDAATAVVLSFEFRPLSAGAAYTARASWTEPRASIRATMSSIDQSRSVIPAAIAGVIRSVLWMRTKL